MQVPLQFEFQSNQNFASYFVGNNGEILQHLTAVAAGQGEQQLYIWGDAGSGKSHLLQATCQQAKLAGIDPFYVSLASDSLPAPAMLEGLETFELVCFDDVQALAGQPEWQRALFAFYNAHRHQGHKLLLAADCPPKFLSYELADLKTRMGWGLTLKIQLLRDDQLIDALAHKAHYLGFELPVPVGRFLLNHYVHELPALWLLLEQIDQATLAAKRKLTIPFLKQILSDASWQIKS